MSTFGGETLIQLVSLDYFANVSDLSGTLFTCPSGAYAVASVDMIDLAGTGTCSVDFDGVNVDITAPNQERYFTFHLDSGDVISYTKSSGTNLTIRGIVRVYRGT